MTYDLTKPDTIFALSKELREISGLTCIDDRRLGAVQDEDGVLFILDATSGAILDTHTFRGGGDYEGVELAGDTMYVLDSDGDLFVLSDWREPKSKARKIETHLSSRHDTEGLAYDAVRQRLLIVCKEASGTGERGERAVYAFRLQDEVLEEAPAFTIRWRDLQAGPKPAAFKPAAMAIHPLTGEMYLVSSVDRRLVVLSSSGTLLDDVILWRDLFPQPEGLAFTSNGDLFVANEGKPATILRFGYRRESDV